MGLSERCKVRRGAVDERKALVDFGLQRARLECLDPQLELRCVHRASAGPVPAKRQFNGRGMDEEWTRNGGGMGWEVRARKVRLAKINPNRARSCPWVTASDSILVDSACARKLELEACAQSSDSGDDALRSVAPWAAANGCSYPVAIRRVLNDSRHCLCEIRDCVHAERGRRMRAKRCSPWAPEGIELPVRRSRSEGRQRHQTTH